MKKNAIFYFLFAIALIVTNSNAIGPHEVMVIANDNSIDSVLVASAFMRVRDIPECNLVRIPVPEKLFETNNIATQEEFTKFIWDPVCAAINERGLSSQILAWVYSCDFPTRIATTPQMSITGMTFLRNKPQPSDSIERGSYISPLFAGPESVDARVGDSQSIDYARNLLLDSTPLLSMMLGYTRERGNSPDEVIAAIEKGASSDGSMPKDTVYLCATDDVRSQCRHWQFSGAVKAITEVGGHAEITDSFPNGKTMAGYMSGSRAAPAALGLYAPGAYADHLTSYAGAFEAPSQTKMSEWLKYGATAASGTVAEPYSLWYKFPNAYIFWHQMNGCTMIESIYQSVRCPLQLLPIGDPLAQPWAKKPQVTVVSPSVTLSGIVKFTAKATGADDMKRFEWLVDGRVVTSSSDFVWNTAEVPNGLHRIRAVAKSNTPVRKQGFRELVVEVEN